MESSKLFPLFSTEHLAKLKSFYVDLLGFEVTMEQESYLQVRSGSKSTDPEWAFLGPEPLPMFKFLKPYQGEGVVLSVPIQNADQSCADMKVRGVEILQEPQDRPWGWRSFVVRDPAGLLLDFFHVLPDSSAKNAPS